MFLQTEDFRQTYLDTSDNITYPTGRLEIGQKLVTVLPGNGDTIMPKAPFVMVIASNQTLLGLINGEHILAWKRDESSSDTFHVIRDWNNFTILDEQIRGTVNHVAGYASGVTEITTADLTGATEWQYFRVGQSAQMYRITAVDGNDITFEPELQEAIAHGEIVRVVADHFKGGTTEPISHERAHVDHEQVLIIQVKINLEEIQDAIGELQLQAYPVDLVGDTLTLAKHLRIGDKKVGFTDAAGMVKYAGGHFQGYNGSGWLNLDEQGGDGGADLPGGVLGDILRYGDSGWESSHILQVLEGEIKSELADFNLSASGLYVSAIESNHGTFGGLSVEGTEVSPTPGLKFVYGDLGVTQGSVIVSSIGEGNPLIGEGWYPLFLLGNEIHIIAQTDIAIQASNDILVRFDNIMEIYAGDGEDVRIRLEDQRNHFYAQSSFWGRVDIEDFLNYTPQEDYPDTPVNGWMIYHIDDGFMVYQAGNWLPITGDSMTFAAPGTAWSTVHYNPDDEEWQYTSDLTIEPIGVRIQKALIIGSRDEEMPEEVGLIEYVNGDFQGIVEGPDGQSTLRVSLTNINPEQRLPSADLAAGALMYAAQNLAGKWVWKSNGIQTWDVANSRLLSDSIKIGDGAGTAGVIRWNAEDEKLEWNDGTTWFSWEQDAVIPVPTTLGAFMFVDGDEDNKNWTETTLISIIDNKLVTSTIEVETLRIGPNIDDEFIEFNINNFIIPTLSSHSLTMIVVDAEEPSIDCSNGWGEFKTLTVDVLNVTTLNLATAEDQSISFEMERLMLKNRESGSIRFIFDPGVEELQLLHDDTDPYIGFYNAPTATFPGTIKGVHTANATTVNVQGLGVVIEAGAYIQIDSNTRRIIATSGTPTTVITLETGFPGGLTDDLAFTIVYGGLTTHIYGDAIIGNNILVHGNATFDYSIRLNNINDLDGELDGVPDEPGMIRYNGDFQGRLANGQWASFTRTLMDGNFSNPWGSSLWWNGSQWAKNTKIDLDAAGAIRLASNATTSAVPGAMRFTGTDFQGCINIGVWQTLTALEDLPTLPSGAGYEGATLRWSNDNWVVNPYLNSDGVKTTVTLLELNPYENFYDAGYVVHTGGYISGTTVLHIEGFNGPLSIDDEIIFDGHETTYTIVARSPTDGPPSTITITPALEENVSDREWLRVQGVLPRPIAIGGQLRYNQNDYEGFIEGVGWASLTGHRSWLPNRIGDPHLSKGNILYYDGTTWLADHNSYMDGEHFTLDKDMVISGDLELAGNLITNGLQVGAPLNYTAGKVTTLAALGADSLLLAGFTAGSISNGSTFRLANHSTVYTVTAVTLTGSIPTGLTITPDLTLAVPAGTKIIFTNAIEGLNDPIALPGFLYFNKGRGRFRGCISETDEAEAPAWVDLVSPIQMVQPPAMGQSLFFNTEADYWHNTNALLINGGTDEDPGLYNGWIRSELPLHVVDWQLKAELLTSGEDDYFQFQIGYGEDPSVDSDAFMTMHTASGNVLKALIVHPDVFTQRMIIGAELVAPVTIDTLSDIPIGDAMVLIYGKTRLQNELFIDAGGLTVNEGSVFLNTGNLFINSGDLVLGEGSLETHDLFASGSGYFGTFIRVGYVETLGGLPAGAVRYSHPGNGNRGDWEGWDGLQWVSFTAGFHGQAIWGEGDVEDGAMVYYDPSYNGGKFRSSNDLRWLDGVLTTENVKLEILDFVAMEVDAAEGRIRFTGSDLQFCLDGDNWISLTTPGVSGIASGTTAGDSIYWTGTIWAPSGSLSILSDRVRANQVLQLVPYEDIDTPAAGDGGMIRFNLNDYEAFVENIGWVSLTGHLPFQQPEDHFGAFLYSDGDNWVASTQIIIAEGETGLDLHIGSEGIDVIYVGKPSAFTSVVAVSSVIAANGGISLGTYDGASLISLGAGGLQYTDANKLQVYQPAFTDAELAWHPVMIGQNAINRSIENGALFFSDDTIINTDVLRLSDVDRVAATILDVTDTLNFGDSTSEDPYWTIEIVGNNWILRNTEAEDEDPDGEYTYARLESTGDLPIDPAVDTVNHNNLVRYKGALYYFDQDGYTFKSVNDGATWTSLGIRDNFALTATQFKVVTYANSSHQPRKNPAAKLVMLGGKNAGGTVISYVFESTDGLTWTQKANLPVATVYPKVVVKSGTGLTGDKIFIFQRGNNNLSQTMVSWSNANLDTAWTVNTPTGLAVNGAGRGCIHHDGYFILGPGSLTDQNFYVSTDGIAFTAYATDLPDRNLYNFTVLGDRLWIIGGVDPGTAVLKNTVFSKVMNPTDWNGWTTESNLNMVGSYWDNGSWDDEEDKFCVFSSDDSETVNTLRILTSDETLIPTFNGSFIQVSRADSGLITFGVDSLFSQDVEIMGDTIFNGLTTFENDIQLHEGTLRIGETIEINDSLASLEVNLEIGSIVAPKTMTLHGDFELDGNFNLAVANFSTDDLVNRGFVGIGNADSDDAWIGAVRFTGAVVCQIDADSVTSTIRLKNVPITVPETAYLEARILLPRNTGKYKITSATDLTGGVWEIEVSPTPTNPVVEDDQARLLTEGDWQGWTGTNWVSFTNNLFEIPEGINITADDKSMLFRKDDEWVPTYTTGGGGLSFEDEVGGKVLKLIGGTFQLTSDDKSPCFIMDNNGNTFAGYANVVGQYITNFESDNGNIIGILIDGFSSYGTGKNTYAIKIDGLASDEGSSYSFHALSGLMFQAQHAEFAGGLLVQNGLNTLHNFSRQRGVDSVPAISSGAITVDKSVRNIDTQALAPTDDLDTLNGGVDGEIITLFQNNTGRVITIRHNIGNILLAGATNFSFGASIYTNITFMYCSWLSKWVEQHRTVI